MGLRTQENESRKVGTPFEFGLKPGHPNSLGDGHCTKYLNRASLNTPHWGVLPHRTSPANAGVGCATAMQVGLYHWVLHLPCLFKSSLVRLYVPSKTQDVRIVCEAYYQESNSRS